MSHKEDPNDTKDIRHQIRAHGSHGDQPAPTHTMDNRDIVNGRRFCNFQMSVVILTSPMP